MKKKMLPSAYATVECIRTPGVHRYECWEAGHISGSHILIYKHQWHFLFVILCIFLTD